MSSWNPERVQAAIGCATMLIENLESLAREAEGGGRPYEATRLAHFLHDARDLKAALRWLRWDEPE